MNAAVNAIRAQRKPSKPALQVVNVKDPEVAQNLLAQMSMDSGYTISVDSKGKYSITAGSNIFEIASSPTEQDLLKNWHTKVKDDLGFNLRYHAGQLIQVLQTMDSVVVKAQTTLKIDPAFAKLDKITSALTGESVWLKYSSFPRQSTILTIDGREFRLIFKKSADAAKKRALQVALYKCLAQEQESDPVIRAARLASLICNFEYEGKAAKLSWRLSDLPLKSQL